jgi:hypothetical protein
MMEIFSIQKEVLCCILDANYDDFLVFLHFDQEIINMEQPTLFVNGCAQEVGSP